MSNETAPDDEDATDVAELTDIHFVGPATAAELSDADFDPTGILDKTVSYEMLLDAGVNPGVAARLRKEHSLHWSFGGDAEDDDSLEQRSEKVRGLQDDERAWVAASSGDWESAEPETGAATDGDWEPTGDDWGSTGDASTPEATADGSGAAEAAEAAWRERSKPDPVTDVPGVDGEDAAVLARAGVTSVRSLATANPEHVADSLGLDADRVAEWRDAARDLA